MRFRCEPIAVNAIVGTPKPAKACDLALLESARRMSVASRVRVIAPSQRYGSPRVHDELREEGERVSRKRVARLMQEQDLRGKRRRRFRVTTRIDP